MGALKKNERYERTGPIFSLSIFILVKSSPKMIISIMIGTAKRESSQMLYVEIVFVPPKKIYEEYSSRALLLSPTKGTYFITTSWSMWSFPSGYKILFALMASSKTPPFEIFFD
jgi:hypothetical protein